MKIAITGYGKMGQATEQLAIENGHNVVSTIDPAMKTAKFKKLTEENLCEADVVIDFTVPAIVLENIDIYIKYGINAVIGTTGWYEYLEEVKKKVEKSKIGLIWSGNFSIGVNLFFRIIKESSELMNNFTLYDVMGYEIHHNRKKDSPSGTMNMIGKILLDNLKNKKKIVTEKLSRKIAEDEIHLASIRGGSIPGTHVITFDSEVDTIELKHTARNRKGLAVGAIKAAEWIKDKKGFYNIEDMMKEIIGG
jgi:4-hydroxy-tetrahydrodipicolinate reductase